MNFGYLFTYLVLSSRHELFVVSLVTSKPTSVGKKAESQLPRVVTAWKERGLEELLSAAKSRNCQEIAQTRYPAARVAGLRGLRANLTSLHYAN